jgi:hypothetical protein
LCYSGKTPTEEGWLVASGAVNSDKIRWDIEGFGSFKFAGEDGIFPALLKNKTSIVLFTNNRKIVGFKKPKVFGKELQLKNQVKYLGFILDEKLPYAAILWWKKASQITAHLQRLACLSITGSMHSTSTAALEVILMLPPLGIYIEGEVRHATYWLNCSGEFTRARLRHSKFFEKMTNEWPSLPPRCSCLSQETLEILPSDGVIFYTAGRLLGCFRIP